jgi:hypothetical protein
MKKASVIFVLSILLIGTIGIGSVLGCYIPHFQAQQTSVHVGEFITIVATTEPGQGCILPGDVLILEEDCLTQSDKAILVNSKCEGNTLTLMYRAVKLGTIKFNYHTCFQTVKILPKPHPMFSFMKILGFGKSD